MDTREFSECQVAKPIQATYYAVQLSVWGADRVRCHSQRPPTKAILEKNHRKENATKQDMSKPTVPQTP